ncbi:hypothetical protein R3P38DRAFT_3266855 [Favolaschia claudopus]|uniref:Uncharacterized protein n=1 Tax=Favolaschia claudopus TaxID=2862362 RepID=A0AAW0BTD5_9AGAR
MPGDSSATVTARPSSSSSTNALRKRGYYVLVQLERLSRSFRIERALRLRREQSQSRPGRVAVVAVASKVMTARRLRLIPRLVATSQIRCSTLAAYVLSTPMKFQFPTPANRSLTLTSRRSSPAFAVHIVRAKFQLRIHPQTPPLRPLTLGISPHPAPPSSPRSLRTTAACNDISTTPIPIIRHAQIPCLGNSSYHAARHAVPAASSTFGSTLFNLRRHPSLPKLVSSRLVCPQCRIRAISSTCTRNTAAPPHRVHIDTLKKDETTFPAFPATNAPLGRSIPTQSNPNPHRLCIRVQS